MQRIQKRRGRPRLDVPEIDKGTVELQQKRRNLLGKGQLQETFLAESLLGVLYAHGVISRPLYETGCFFGDLGYRYEPCLGHSFRSRASVLTPLRVDTCWKGDRLRSDRSDERITQAWRTALNVLKGAGPGPTKTVLKVVFYDQDLYAAEFSPSSFRERESLQCGLVRLNLYFKGELKGNPNKLCHSVQSSGKSTTLPRSLKGSQPVAPP